MEPQILLIRAGGRNDAYRAIPWGIVDIGSYLKKHGYQVAILDRLNNRCSIKTIMRQISKKNIKCVGISAMTSQTKDAEFLCKNIMRLKKNIILGGLHYDIFPDAGLKIADYVFRGEAECSLLDFLQNGPRERVYESKPLLDLDDIPIPTPQLLSGLYLNKDSFVIMTSRGCIFDCNFCLDKRYRFQTIRYHSPAYVCDLIEMFIFCFGIRDFLIGDDIFTINKERVIGVCREIRKRSLKVSLSAFTHTGFDDLEMYKEMKDAGFKIVSLGIESGSDEVLKMMNKKQTVANIKRTIGIIKKSGLQVNALFMVGNILETEKSLKESLELARELGLCGWVSYAQPFPGTRFYEDCLRYGRLINFDPRTYWNDRISFIPRGLSPFKLKCYYDKIAFSLKAPLPLHTRIIYKVLRKCRLGSY